MTVEFLMAFGLVFVIEGLLYALVPGHLKGMLRTMQELTDDQLRMGGVSAIALGVGIVWLARSLTG
ncbi:MAG: DUF2065 domain-containing protein [Aestuariivirga sp.]